MFARKGVLNLDGFEGYLQAERGELIDGAQARHEIQAMKDNWQQERLPKR